MGLFDRLRGKPTPTPARQARQARPAVGQHVGGLQHHPGLGYDNRSEARLRVLQGLAEQLAA